MMPEDKLYDSFLKRALHEDKMRQDITTHALFSRNVTVKAVLIAKQAGFLAGSKLSQQLFALVDPALKCNLLVQEGARLKSKQDILSVEGSVRSIFAAERTVLNLLGHLSGIATLTQAFVEKIKGTKAQIYDTRKTLPGLRYLEKYAVCIGGGKNHRMDLSDAALIKSNHLRALGLHKTGSKSQTIQRAIVIARQVNPQRFIEVEVGNLSDYQAALGAEPNAILLDNMSYAEIARAVKLRADSYGSKPKSILEVSGGVTLATARPIAKTGIERISIGRLTHSAPWFDVSLKVVTE